MSQPGSRSTLLALGLALQLLASGGCSDSARRPAAECCPCGQAGAGAARKIDEKLMALLGAARGYHHQADLLLRRGERGKAIAALRSLLELELDARWPEAEEVRLDATARLAKLLLAEGQATAALERVDAELAKGPRESFYAANLHAVRGELLESRVKALDADGEKDRAREAAREAIAAFERSIAINKRLQRSATTTRPAKAPTKEVRR